MSYVISFCDIALKELDKHPAAVPKRLVVEVGEMTGVLPEYLQKYYPLATKKTRLYGTSLKVISIPVLVRCNACEREYTPNKTGGYACPSCHSTDATLLHGRECNLKQIELEE